MYGERIKRERMKRGWTMDQFAQKINVAKSSVAGYESKNRQPPLDRLEKIATVLNVSTDYILGLTDDPDPKKEQRNIYEFLNKKPIHYNGIELTDAELAPVRQIIDMIAKSHESTCTQNMKQ